MRIRKDRSSLDGSSARHYTIEYVHFMPLLLSLHSGRMM